MLTLKRLRQLRAPEVARYPCRADTGAIPVPTIACCRSHPWVCSPEKTLDHTTGPCPRSTERWISGGFPKRKFRTSRPERARGQGPRGLRRNKASTHQVVEHGSFHLGLRSSGHVCESVYVNVPVRCHWRIGRLWAWDTIGLHLDTADGMQFVGGSAGAASHGGIASKTPDRNYRNSFTHPPSG